MQLRLNNFSKIRLFHYGDSVTVSFKTKADLSKYGIYKIITYGYDNNDDYIFNDTLLGINIENTKLDESLSVFPNPFTISLQYLSIPVLLTNFRYQLLNVSGVKLYDIERDIISGKNKITISDLRLLPSLYYLNIRGTTINKTIPVLKINK